MTYQHSRFIGQAIDGALRQKTDFPTEILVGEDDSTDGTRQICEDYAKRHPQQVQVFLRRRSDVVFIDGLPRGSYNFRQTVRAARGEFVALCEGDDYWTDPEKLQRQVDYLRANPNCVGCFHDSQLVDSNSNCIQESYFQSDQEKFNQADVLATLLSRQPTCSLVFRKSAFVDPLPAWYLRRPCDLYLDILLTNQGTLGFIRRNMSAYRKHPGGIWSGERESNQIIELIIRYKLLLADAYFLAKYKELLLRKVDEFQAALFSRNDLGKEIVRLETIVADQANLIGVTQAERLRLEKEVVQARHNYARQLDGSSMHVTHLKNQLDQLAATSKQQHGYISSLEKARDESCRLVADLKAQLDKLAATSAKQDGYISILEKERDRLTALSKVVADDCNRYIKVITEQTAYIKVLEAERKNGIS